jgi:hypothetical protein
MHQETAVANSVRAAITDGSEVNAKGDVALSAKDEAGLLNPTWM